MSEKLNKLRRKYLRFMAEQGVKPRPKREPVLGHSNALCATGRHDFVGPFTRARKKRHVKIRDGRSLVTIGSKTVWDKSPRVRVCRQCGQTQAHAKTGQWINAGK